MWREWGGTLKKKRVPESRHKPGLGYRTRTRLIPFLWRQEKERACRHMLMSRLCYTPCEWCTLHFFYLFYFFYTPSSFILGATITQSHNGFEPNAIGLQSRYNRSDVTMATNKEDAFSSTGFRQINHLCIKASNMTKHLFASLINQRVGLWEWFNILQNSFGN